MKVSEFNFDLPEELIAQKPLPERATSRMLVLERRGGGLAHREFSVLPDLLRQGDLVVLNNTRVIPARAFARRGGTGGRVELLFLEALPDGSWLSLYRAANIPPAGLVVHMGPEKIPVEVLEVLGYGKVRVRVLSGRPVTDILDEIGIPPLPPYIKRDRKIADPDDKERYQTVFAKEPGAVAAPTAGLHFTPEILDQLRARGVNVAWVTLHVGLGTFRPIKCETVEEHVMDSERYDVPPETADLVARTKAAGGRIVAVGSTSVRVLETVMAEHGRVVPCSGRTAIFIYPPFEFRVVDCMLTNFHLPMSTLLMMVCAFAGKDAIDRAYAEAVSLRYRFFSYGDCMFIG